MPTDDGDDEGSQSSDAGSDESSSPSLSGMASDIDRRRDAGEEPRTADAEDDEPESDPSLSDLVDAVRERKAGSRRAETEDRAPPDLDPSSRTSREPQPEGTTDGPESAFEQLSGGPGSDPKTQALLELIGESGNLLLLGPLQCPADYDLGAKVMDIQPGEAVNLLLVTLTQSPDERLDTCRGYLGDIPSTTTIVNVGDSVRGGAATTTNVDERGQVTIKTVSDPSDVMRLGISISKSLSEWGGSDARMVVCFHSLSALLQFVDDRQSAFRFLHILQGRINEAGAQAHYHMDSSAHDQETIGMFRPLFDAVITFDESGAISIDG